MGEPLNVVLVVLGGARADRLSSHGYVRETTPFLDRVARQGVRFSNAVSTAPKALSAHASLFTGLFTSTHGASEERPQLDDRHATLAETLAAAGYRTAAFCSNPSVAPATGFGRGFEVFRSETGDGRSIARAAYYARRASDRLLRRSDAGARRSNLALFDWLNGDTRPFFAFLHYGETRLRRQPPASHERLFVPQEIKRGQLRAVERGWTRPSGIESDLDERRRLLGDVYDGALRYVDERVAEVAAHLESRGLWDRTLLVVTADHGEDLGEHDLASPGFGLYDTLLRVPLLVRCPPLVPQGFVVEEVAQHVDLLPTILQLVDLEERTPVTHGRALLRCGQATEGPGFAVAECLRPDLEALRKRRPGVDLRRFDIRQRAIRTRREKYIWRSDEANEIYDLVADPGEQCDLSIADPARAQRLRSQLFAWLGSIERRAPEERGTADEAARRQA